MSAVLVALRGLPGIGKSTFAQTLGRALGWPYLDKDAAKAVTVGHADDPGRLAYELLFAQCRGLLEQGFSVVCDSPLLYPSLYAAAQRTAHSAHARLLILDCILADEQEHRRRLEQRTSLPPWRLTDWPALLHFRAQVPPLTFASDVPRLQLDLSLPLETLVAQASTWLRLPH